MEAHLLEALESQDSIPPPLKQQIVLEHTPLIRYIVSRIAARLPPHVDLEDLHNTGVIGLMDAIEKFDPNRDCKFKTYAEFRVKGAILDELRALDWVPRSVRQKGRQLERAYEEVEQRLGRAACDDEVARSLGIELEELHTLSSQANGISVIHMDQLRSNDDMDAPLPGDIFEDPRSENPFDSVKARQEAESLSDGIAHLPAREKLVITLYYFEDLSMKEIGSVLGITESRVCQIHAKALSHLRGQLGGTSVNARRKAIESRRKRRLNQAQQGCMWPLDGPPYMERPANTLFG
jgi:RNA polymerase sigma factor for flagellar operon FliA